MEKFFRHPWVIVGAITAITVFFAWWLPKAQMDNNFLAFLPEDNPARVATSHLEEEYGDSTTVMVGLEKLYGTVFERDFLSRLREYSGELEALPLVKNINSILSTQYISSDSESIIVSDLVDEDFSGTQAEIAELKRRIDSWDVYRGSLVSDDLSSTQIVVELKVPSELSGEPEVMAALRHIRELAKEMFSGYAGVYVAGQAVVSATLTESALADAIILIPLVIAVLLAVLIFSFRRFSYITLPLLTVLAATIWAVGAMPLFGVKLSMLSMTLPVMLIAVGNAYSIHVVSHYKDEVKDKILKPAEHRLLVLNVVRRLVKPVFLASLTTFAGFISFCFAPLTSMRDFGIFASFGVLAAFAIAMLLIPAILIIRGARTAGIAGGTPRFNLDHKLAGVLGAIAKRRILVLAAAALVVIVSLAGMSKMVIDSSMVEFFNEKSEVNRSDKFIREHFGGSTQIIVSVEADSTETLLSPQVLGAIDGLSTYLAERVPKVGKVTGFTDMVKRMNQMFNVGESPEGLASTGFAAGPDTTESDFGFGFGDFGFDEPEVTAVETVPSPDNTAGTLPRPFAPPAQADSAVTFAMVNSAAGKKLNMSANELIRELQRMTNYEGYGYYEIPTDPARYGKTTEAELQQLVSNYLVLLAGDSEQSMSNDPLEPTAVETIVLVNSQWQKDASLVMTAIRDYAAAHFPDNVKVLIGGGATQMGAITDLVTSGQIISIIIAVFSVLIIVALSNRSIASGLIAALPLLIAIFCNFAVMGYLGITLNVATVMIGSLAVGIGIDYTIHFMESFKREYAAGGDYLRRTFTTSGKAILINAVSVGASFGVFAFSNFDVIAQFGGLIALSMGVSAMVSLTVIPALITTVKPKFIYGAQGVLR